MPNFTLIDNFFLQYHFTPDLLKPYSKIYVLVSGGYDSTLLAEWVAHHFPDKVYYVNCFNPFEQSATLTEFETKGLIIIKPKKKHDYGSILKKAFLNLNKAAENRSKEKYDKHIFQCCKIIKHRTFMNDPLFKEPNTVIISGIKAGDGNRRNAFLAQLRAKNTFFHLHKKGQFYCYPFRDYFKRDFPKDIDFELKKIYPKLEHSGCAICPVLVVFHDLVREHDKRFYRSVEYAKKLIQSGEFVPSPILLQYCSILKNSSMDSFLKKKEKN